MKKIISLLLVIVLCFSAVACSSQSKITLGEMIEAYETATGMEIDREEKPMYSLIGAEDGVIFYINGKVVKIYEYASASALNKAVESYEQMSDWPVAGSLILETSNEDAIEVFEAVVAGKDIPTISTESSELEAGISSELEATPEPEPAVEESELSLGETVFLDDWEITATSYEVADSIKSSEYTSFNSDDGSKYVSVNLTIKNTGTTSNTFVDYISLTNDTIKCKIFYQDKYEYSSTNLMGYDLDLHYKRLNPLETFSGIMAYSVVDEAALSDELTFHISFGDNTYIYKLDNSTATGDATENVEESQTASSESQETSQPSLSVTSSPEATPEVKKVTVPYVVNMDSYDATNALDKLGVSYQLTYEYIGETPQSPNYVPPGVVAYQSLEAGSEVTVGTTISLVVSKGPESAATPDNPDA